MVFTLLKRYLHLFGQKSLSEREWGAIGTKVITPGKIVPNKCCRPSLNIHVKKDFNTDVLLQDVVTHIQVLSVTFIEYGQNVNKYNIS